MKKRGRMGGGLVLGASLVLSIYAAAQTLPAQPLTQTQTNFSSYTVMGGQGKLTQDMWNGLVAKLDTLANNHESRLMALEGPVNCSPQSFKFESIKFTTFSIQESIRNGETRNLTMKANLSEIKASPFPNGLPPEWKITVACEQGKLKLIKNEPVCPTGGLYHPGLGTCGVNTCRQEASKEIGNSLGQDWFDAGSPDGSAALKCQAIEDLVLFHGNDFLKKAAGYYNRASSEPCYEKLMCDNGAEVHLGFSQSGAE